MNKRINHELLTAIVALLAALPMAVGASAALTAQQVAQKAAAVIAGAKGLSAGFVATGSGVTSKGTINGSGTKFSVITPQVSIWYNGKSLYTYNPRTSETTITTPDAQELLESNPLLYVKGGVSGYTCTYSATRQKGKYVVDLTPRNKRSGIKKMTFTVNASDFHINKIVVVGSGGTTTVNVTSFKTGVAFPASVFEYPKARYPKAEIIDLR